MRARVTGPHAPEHDRRTVKFLCDSCKAKYQIADEKVAGKTVRMKCRKCGHQIEVRAAVTETSVASALPRATNAPLAPQAPRRSGGLATSLSATKPRAPSAGAPGALAGAFQRNVQEASASVPPSADRPSNIDLSVTSDWYVAINGVPVGPVRVSELRRKAAAGAITDDSLCWQEGLEEWRPIGSVPELAALVREAAQSSRPSLVGPPSSEPSIRTSTPPPAPRTTAPSAPKQPTAPRAPSAPRHTPPPPAPRPVAPSTPSAVRSNVVPLRPAASAALDEVPLGPSGGIGAAAALAPPAPARLSQPTPAPLAPLAADPFTADPFAAPKPAPMGPLPSGVPLQPVPAYEQNGKRGGVPLWFWPILVVALGFGGGVAFLAFRPQPAPAPVVIQMPQAPAALPTATQRDDVPPPPAAEPAAPAPEDKPKPANPTPAKTATTSKPAPEEKKGLDLGNLVPGAGGPNVGPSPGPGGASGGGLDQASVERVVAAHRTGVKRTCWERGGADKSSANVTVTATVAPNGSVSSTSSSGDDPVVAKCIEAQVRTWQFPAPGSTATIAIPFKFVRQ